MLKITEETINPFVRCVGFGTGLNQKILYCACDYRLVYFTEGTGRVLCGTGTYRSEAGDLFIFAPGVKFAVQSSPEQSCIVVNFDWTQNHASLSAPVLSVPADAFTGDRIIEKADLSALGLCGDVIRLQVFFEAEELLRQLHKVYFMGVKPNGIWMSGLLKQLVGMLAVRLRSAQQNSEKTFLLTDRVLAYVQENYAAKLSLDGVAAHFHYHPTYINRAMKAATGVSFHQYLIDFRLKQSMQLLEMKTMTMEEIAARTGFSNSKHFSACFKKHFGISPSRYI